MSAQSEWNRRNPAATRAAAARWRARHPDKVQAANAHPRKRDWNRLERYGMTAADFSAMMARQHGRCACCGARIDSGGARDAHVDHCHATGKVRGLLCGHCNSALGFARESAATLYQMAAYLELDRKRPVVYLVGSLRNPRVVEVGNEVRALGLECVDNWVAASPTADDAWQAYSTARGRSYAQALESREARHVFHFDRAYLNLADAVVLLYPAGKSGHLEFGYGVGQGKRGYLLMEEPAERYDVMLQFASAPLFHSLPELLDALRADLLANWRPIP